MGFQTWFKGLHMEKVFEVTICKLLGRDLDEDERKSIGEEVQIMKCLSGCTALMHVIDGWFKYSTADVTMVNNLYRGPNLRWILSRDDKLQMNINQVKKYAQTILQALSYLHSKGVAHRNLHTANMLC